ncbi:Protein C37A2.8 a [Aphelenchoides avenae]|nr:Protein C37A2.8 a [Aphelenchus avenae]
MADEEDEKEAAPSKRVLNTNNISSLLDLKTEFLQKKKIAQTAQSYARDVVRGKGGGVLLITKEEKHAKDEQSRVRQERIHRNKEAWQKEEAERLRREQIMQQKTAQYERLSKGDKLAYTDGTSADFLVDFTMKKRGIEDKEARRDAEPYADSDEERPRTPPPPLIVHYDHSEDKGRVFGASHMPLPIFDEDERQKKIGELKKMTEETKQIRQKKKKERDSKKRVERARINRMRAKRGLPPVESSESEEEEDADEEQRPETSQEPPAEITEIPLPEGEPQAAPPPKKPKVREWDRGKTGHMQWISERRDEREEEFAPPSSYNNDRRKK